ncbi:MAG: DUF503 domain-containing protein [Clostridiales bacterium]|nr:DUF503 domain-containing protein [Clostridiales bacterium]
MIVGIVKVKIYIPFAHSLKEKRTIVKSLCSKIKNNFNVSISEVENQDVHQTIGLGIAIVSNNSKHIDSIIDKIINYIEANTEGEIIEINREIV